MLLFFLTIALNQPLDVEAIQSFALELFVLSNVVWHGTKGPTIISWLTRHIVKFLNAMATQCIAVLFSRILVASYSPPPTSTGHQLLIIHMWLLESPLC